MITYHLYSELLCHTSKLVMRVKTTFYCSYYIESDEDENIYLCFHEPFKLYNYKFNSISFVFRKKITVSWFCFTTCAISYRVEVFLRQEALTIEFTLCPLKTSTRCR